MQRCIDDIRRELSRLRARTAWDRGVRGYAEELFSDYLDALHIDDGSLRIGKIKEADLLNGAKDWTQFSYGGCAEVSDYNICERLCNKSEKRKLRDGELSPDTDEEWLDVQARALSQAAWLVIRAVNRRDVR